MTLNLFKHCNKCHKEQPMMEYGKNHSTKDGFTTYCRTCLNQTAKERYILNREKLISQCREWSQKNKQRVIFLRRRRSKLPLCRIKHNLHKKCGCSMKQLGEHLKTLFTSEMSIENYGKVWQISHIKSRQQCSPEEYSHYTNLKPVLRDINTY